MSFICSNFAQQYPNSMKHIYFQDRTVKFTPVQNFLLLDPPHSYPTFKFAFYWIPRPSAPPYLSARKEKGCGEPHPPCISSVIHAQICFFHPFDWKQTRLGIVTTRAYSKRDCSPSTISFYSIHRNTLPFVKSLVRLHRRNSQQEKQRAQRTAPPCISSVIHARTLAGWAIRCANELSRPYFVLSGFIFSKISPLSSWVDAHAPETPVIPFSTSILVLVRPPTGDE